MLIETSIIDKIELVPNAVQIRHKKIIEKDSVEIASIFNREVVIKNSEVNHLDKKTQAICELWLNG